MTMCFKDHDCDALALNRNTRPIAECKSYYIEERGRQVRIIDVPILTCKCLWRAYQKEAEEIVAPGGTLIADPRARNRAINAAYARLWLHDRRFQWAGLAAFASKQVGCGLLHAADAMNRIKDEREARERMEASAVLSAAWPGIFSVSRVDDQAKRDYDQARRNNPVPTADLQRDGDPLSLLQQQYKHVYDMMALGNTTLFLDAFPLHAFYAKRGMKELRHCLPARIQIADKGNAPILWPISSKLQFGRATTAILKAFEAIDAGNIAESVKQLLDHEQRYVLQTAMYSDKQLVALLRGNHASYVTGIPSGVAEAIELTLASQCRRAGDGLTIGFGDNPLADLSDIDQRMPFVLRAAARFDELLRSDQRGQIEQSIRAIAASGGVQ
jgi:hypothetical protein